MAFELTGNNRGGTRAAAADSADSAHDVSPTSPKTQVKRPRKSVSAEEGMEAQQKVETEVKELGADDSEVSAAAASEADAEGEDVELGDEKLGSGEGEEEAAPDHMADEEEAEEDSIIVKEYHAFNGKMDRSLAKVQALFGEVSHFLSFPFDLVSPVSLFLSVFVI